MQEDGNPSLCHMEVTIQGMKDWELTFVFGKAEVTGDLTSVIWVGTKP